MAKKIVNDDLFEEKINDLIEAFGGTPTAPSDSGNAIVTADSFEAKTDELAFTISNEVSNTIFNTWEGIVTLDAPNLILTCRKDVGENADQYKAAMFNAYKRGKNKIEVIVTESTVPIISVGHHFILEMIGAGGSNTMLVGALMVALDNKIYTSSIIDDLSDNTHYLKAVFSANID